MNSQALFSNSKKRCTYPSRPPLADLYQRDSKQIKTDPKQAKNRTLSYEKMKISKDPPNISSHQIQTKIPKQEIIDLVSFVKTVSDKILTIVDKCENKFGQSRACARKHKRIDSITIKLESEIQTLKTKLEHFPPLPAKNINVDLEKLSEELKTIKEMNNSTKESKENLLNNIDFLMSQGEQSKKYCKNMHELLQNIRENIRVFCRIKPSLISRSTSPLDFFNSNSDVIQIPTVTEGFSHSVPILAVSGIHYIFDNVFGPDTNQAKIFEGIPMWESAQNTVMFLIGEKGSGKHYTLNGPLYNITNLENQITELSGILPRFLQNTMNSMINEVKVKGFNICPNGIEDILSLENQAWITLENSLKMGTILKEFTINSEKAKIKHSVFQVKITAQNKERTVTFVILEDIKARAASDQKEKDFVSQTYKALSEVLKILVDIKLRGKTEPPYKASGLTKILSNTLQPNSKIMIISNMMSQDGPGTQTTLSFLRDSALLV